MSSFKTSLSLITTGTNFPCILVTGKRFRIPFNDSIKSHKAKHLFRFSHFWRFNSETHVDFVRNCDLVLEKQRRFAPHACSYELPLLPFPTDQVLVPSESKTLHLYESRYLALLDESLFQKKRLFVHFVLDPIDISDSSAEASFAARYGCLVVVEKVEQLDVGALVSIRGIGRVKIVRFEQADPYLKGVVIPVQDNATVSESKISSKILDIKEALYSLNSLEIKLKARNEALLQTRTVSSLTWAEKELPLDCDEAFIPSFAERLSFAALQPVSGSSQSELLKLQEEKLRAMDVKDTVERLHRSLEYVKNNIYLVAAKLAIQSLEVQ